VTNALLRIRPEALKLTAAQVEENANVGIFRFER